MRDRVKRAGRRVRAGWFWPLALLTFPMCMLDFDSVGPQPPTAVFDPGPAPVTSAIMCDIPKVVVEEGAECATDDDLAIGMSLARAAVALNLGESSPIALDFSSDAIAECGGQPRKIEFHGSFPDGSIICLNCGTQIPAVYADPTAACVAKCTDLINFGDGPMPDEGAEAFCAAKARVSTNFDKDGCYADFCTMGGMPTANDPRRNPENVTWPDTETINTTADGNSVSFGGRETGDFSAGAASEQLITEGDAWVELEAGQNDRSHVIGLRTSCDVIANCPDEDGTLADIPLSLSLNVDNAVYVLLGDEVVAGPFADYSPGERFRIHVVERFGTAEISFTRLPAPCTPNLPCAESPPLYTHPVGFGYPLRIDVTFRETNASLENVTIMRIIR